MTDLLYLVRVLDQRPIDDVCPISSQLSIGENRHLHSLTASRVVQAKVNECKRLLTSITGICLFRSAAQRFLNVRASNFAEVLFGAGLLAIVANLINSVAVSLDGSNYMNNTGGRVSNWKPVQYSFPRWFPSATLRPCSTRRTHRARVTPPDIHPFDFRHVARSARKIVSLSRASKRD